MIVTTIDPVTGRTVTGLEQHRCVVEGDAAAATKIYFESEDTRRAYLLARPGDPGIYRDHDTPFDS